MILKELSKYLHQYNEEIIANKITCSKLLCEWVKFVVRKKPETHVEKIIHKEIMLALNESGDFLIVGKSESGRTLVNALYNFALSYEQHLIGRWISEEL